MAKAMFEEAFELLNQNCLALPHGESGFLQHLPSYSLVASQNQSVPTNFIHAVSYETIYDWNELAPTFMYSHQFHEWKFIRTYSFATATITLHQDQAQVHLKISRPFGLVYLLARRLIWHDRFHEMNFN